MSQRLIRLLAMLVTFTGCARSYEADLSNAQSRSSPRGGRQDRGVLMVIDPQVRLISIDGAVPPGIPPEVRNGEFSDGRRLRLAPGPHRIVAGSAAYTYSDTDFYAYLPPSSENDELSFDARAGRSYLLKIQGIHRGSGFQKPSLDHWRAVVIDRDGPRWDTVVSTTVARTPHGPGG
jgi:hypothetical protein